MKNKKGNYGYLLIAGLYCKLEILDDDFFEYLRQEYFILNAAENTDYRVRIEKTGTGYRFKTKTFEIITEAKPEYGLRYFDFVLMTVIAVQAMRDGILFLHASSIRVKDHGYLFFGHSGSGKTTVTRNVPVGDLFSEDTAVLKEEAGTFYLYRSPFDRRKLEFQGNEKVPVKAIFLLRKSRSNRIRPIPVIIKLMALKASDLYSFAAGRIFRNGYQKGKTQMDRLFLKLISGVKMVKLEFTRDYDPIKSAVKEIKEA